MGMSNSSPAKIRISEGKTKEFILFLPSVSIFGEATVRISEGKTKEFILK